MNETLQIIFALIFVFCVIFAIISDITSLRIPNIVSIVLVVSFAVYALLGGIPAVWPHVIIAGVVFVLLFASFGLGWVGAGDVKFLTALTVWAGPSHGTVFILLFAIFGGVFALSLIGLRSMLPYYPTLAGWPVIGKMSRWARNGLCPYGIPIGLAALCVAPSIFMVR